MSSGIRQKSVDVAERRRFQMKSLLKSGLLLALGLVAESTTVCWRWDFWRSPLHEVHYI